MSKMLLPNILMPSKRMLFNLNRWLIIHIMMVILCMLLMKLIELKAKLIKYKQLKAKLIKYKQLKAKLFVKYKQLKTIK